DNYKDNLSNYLELTGQADDEGRRLSTNTESEGRYHSNWLNMMYPRLMLARNLLKGDGVIFISIDDNEPANLKRLCDEIFGEENFVANLVWKSGRTASSHFTEEHEYIISYSKNLKFLELFEYNGDDLVSDRAIKKLSVKNPISAIKFPEGIDFDSPDRICPKEFGDKEPVKIDCGILESKDFKLKNEVVISAAWSMASMIESWLQGNEVYDQKGQKITRFFF